MKQFEDWAQAVERTAAIIKRKFNNLTVEETLRLSHEIVAAVLAPTPKVGVQDE